MDPLHIFTFLELNFVKRTDVVRRCSVGQWLTVCDKMIFYDHTRIWMWIFRLFCFVAFLQKCEASSLTAPYDSTRWVNLRWQMTTFYHQQLDDYCQVCLTHILIIFEACKCKNIRRVYNMWQSDTVDILRSHIFYYYFRKNCFEKRKPFFISIYFDF